MKKILTFRLEKRVSLFLFEKFGLFFILVLAFGFRLYKIDSPIADWHSWRQADTSAVSRQFIKKGFDVLHPRFDDLSSIPTGGLENPSGYRFVEFPFYNLIQASFYRLFPVKTIEWWGRMTSILFSLGSIIFIFLIVKKFINWRLALLASFFFAILPYNVYYSRAVLPEPMMVFSSLGMIYFFSRWIDMEKFISYLLFVFFAIISFLLKPFTVFFLIPLFYLAFRKWRRQVFKKTSLYLGLIISLVPFFAWRLWMSQFPEGIPKWTWLLNHENIRFKGAFFRWLFAERLGRLVLGFWGLPLFVFGLVGSRNKKEDWFFYWWLFSVLAYWTVFAAGNIRHDYYQILAIPILVIFLAKGVFFLFTSKNLDRFIRFPVLIVSCLFMLAFSWYEVRDFYQINHPEIVQAGRMADKILPSNAKVIAPYNGDTAFLYQINRQGWPHVTVSIDYLISRGATHFVSVNFDETTKKLMEQFKVLERQDQFVIIDLTSQK